jgi:hypothetical protein
MDLVREKAPTRAITYTSYTTQSESVGFQIQRALSTPLPYRFC